MKKGGVRLLEPVMKVEVSTPEEHMGDVIGDLNSRRGLVGEFVDRPGNIRLIKSFVPLSEMCACSSSCCVNSQSDPLVSNGVHSQILLCQKEVHSQICGTHKMAKPVPQQLVSAARC